jgi:hypothetical protein
LQHGTPYSRTRIETIVDACVVNVTDTRAGRPPPALFRRKHMTERLERWVVENKVRDERAAWRSCERSWRCARSRLTALGKYGSQLKWNLLCRALEPKREDAQVSVERPGKSGWQ